jgi:hypothetical protein
MTIRASREIVIDAAPDAILDVLADVAALPSWATVYKRAEVVDSYADGRPHHVNVTIKVFGLVDKEELEYHWGPDWLVWDAKDTGKQHAQHVEYQLQPVGEERTRVRVDITVETAAPLPGFLVERASNTVLSDATEGLRRQVIG